ncbi:MAG: hypothetical protein NT023_25645 [Armatimonadetes bacterium]|nr:hypothetical protein [Armatimonadota bacterium]
MAMKAVYATVNGRVLSQTRSGVRSFYSLDPLGNTRALYDNTQTKTDTFTYTPFGTVTRPTGTTPTPFQWNGGSGYYQNSATRVYVRARNYYANLGKWSTQDPIGFAGGDFNLYSYVLNQVVTWSDPSGLNPNDSCRHLKGSAKWDCYDKQCAKWHSKGGVPDPHWTSCRKDGAWSKCGDGGKGHCQGIGCIDTCCWNHTTGQLDCRCQAGCGVKTPPPPPDCGCSSCDKKPTKRECESCIGRDYYYKCTPEQLNICYANCPKGWEPPQPPDYSGCLKLCHRKCIVCVTNLGGTQAYAETYCMNQERCKSENNPNCFDKAPIDCMICVDGWCNTNYPNGGCPYDSIKACGLSQGPGRQ